jgi:hypothetical protein
VRGVPRALTCACAALCVAACGSHGGAAASSPGARDPTPPEPPPYTVLPNATWGRITGVVTADAARQRDSTVVPLGAESDCGTRLTIPAVDVRAGRLVNAVVWLDARAGKPLPVERRFELAHENCIVQPRVQAVVVGGTLNVNSDDATVVHLRFARARGGGASDSTLAVVRETDAGQVVPVTGLFQHPGMIAVTSDTQPWMRAWIRVFDQPYFDVTDRAGTFRMDSVPAGTYRLTVWQDRVGMRTRTVRVRPNEETRVTVRY